jgi:HAD superfamily hydrolase (TIGR01509 family)
MNAATRERELQGIPLKQGVVEMLEQVGGLGLPLVVVTSSRQSRAIFKLSHCRLSGHFRSLVALEDVERPKPAPEPYLAAARTLDIRPARMLVFEDSEAGVASARAAGATVVQVPDILPAGGLAHFTAPSLMEGARMAGLFR